MADTKISALPAVTTVASTDELPVNQAGISKKVTALQLRTYVNADIFVTAVADQANSTVTAASVTGLDTTVGAGTYLVKYWVCFRSAATATGIEMYLHHTGTVSRLVSTWYTLTTGGTAATGIADQATATAAQMMEGKGQRATNVASGTMAGVDTANADQFAVIEGIVVVTVSGTLQLLFRSEVAASAVTIMTGTTLTLTKVA